VMGEEKGVSYRAIRNTFASGFRRSQFKKKKGEA
jgi:hypothetical protein